MTDIGTELFARTLAFDYGDEERSALMRKVWSPTPFMVNVDTGSPDSDRYREILQWCRENIGPQAHPIHGKDGDWQTGTATVFGWTWMGFATEDLLNRFLAAFPSLGVQP